MEGVTILSEVVKHTIPWLLIIALLVCIIVIVYYIYEANIYLNQKKYLYFALDLLYVCVICFFFILGVYFCFNVKHTEYKVTISDSVKYKDFTDKYEVISQEGEIYTVKLRELEE